MTTWYISPSGNDTTGDGSVGNPYLTVNKCHTVGANGDTVVCADGTYRQYGFTISKTNWTIQAAAGAKPIFIPGHAYETWSKTAGQTDVYEADYTSGSCWGVWNGTTKLASVADVATCDSTHNSYYFDNAGDHLYVNIGGDAPTSLEVYDVSNNNALIVTGTGFTVDGLTFRYQMQPIDVQAGSSTIRKCTFDRNVGYNNSMVFGMIQLDGSTHLVEHCSFSGVWAKTWCVGGKATSSNITVQHCTIGETSYGIYFNGGTGHLAQYNTIHDTYSDCINWEAGSGTACYNICYDFSHGAIRGNASGTVIAHHNIAYLTQDVRTGSTGAVWGFIVDPGGTVEWYNNTVANLARASSSSGKAAFYVQSNETVTAKNNIAYGNASGYNVGAAYNPTLDCDYNCANTNSTNYVSDWTQGTHDVITDPLFVCTLAGRDDLRLRQGSPCIDAGTTVSGVTEGFRGAGPDIGALEYITPRGGRRRS